MFMVTGKGCSVCRMFKKVVEDEGLDVQCKDVESMDNEELETAIRSGIKTLPILVTKNGLVDLHGLSKNKFLEIVNANI